MYYKHERIYRDLLKRDAQEKVKELRIRYGKNIRMRKDPNGRYEVWAAEYYKVRK